MEQYTIKQLPSGFWSVWDGDTGKHGPPSRKPRRNSEGFQIERGRTI